MNLFPWFLFAHVLGAIIAFGPTFSFPIIGRLGAQERTHANFATRLSYALSRVQVVPFAILQGVTGIGLVITGNIDVTTPWLLIGILLYLVALTFALFVQTPTVKQVIALTTVGPPPGGAPDAGAGPGGAPAGPAAAGPPPQLRALIRRVQLGGLFLMALIVTIVFLMVAKPAF